MLEHPLPPVKTVAVLGTGIIGSAVARNLDKHEIAVRTWNRSPTRSSSLAARGIDVLPDAPTAVAGADVVITLLKDGQAVLDVMRTAIPRMARGAIWLQMSTVGMNATAALFALAQEHGIVFIDAPVQGTRGPAEQGQLIVLASGPRGTEAALQPVFNAIAKRTVWVSERVGDSSKLKLALNSWAFALTHGIAESLAIAEGLGVDPALVVSVVKGGPMDCLYFQTKAAAILEREYTPSFSIANAVKDAKLVIEAAQQAGVTADLALAGGARFERALANGYGDLDMAASYLVSRAAEWDSNDDHATAHQIASERR